MKKQKTIALLLMTLIILSLLPGCSLFGKSEPSPTAPASAATKSTIPVATAVAPAGVNNASGAETASPGTVSKQTTSSSKTKKTVPALTTVKFSLSLKPEQSYTENAVPIYLTADQVLHLEWLTESVTSMMRMIITTPDGKYLGVTTNCELAQLPEGSILCQQLNKIDNLVFKAELWGDGYYIFHPNLQSGDGDVSIKLLYWIE